MTAGEISSETLSTPPVPSRRVAAVDCGTNSIRLLIAEVDPARRVLTDVTRQMEIVRLGQGVDATGQLAPEALARTMAALAGYAGQIRAAGATAVRMVATSASRDASNAAEFTAGVRSILGIAPEVVTGAQEARLSFTGATVELAASPSLPAPFLVVDIGGGSTEFVTGDPAGPAESLRALSTDVGCVRMTERHLHDDPPTAAQVAEATADIDAAIDAACAAVPAADAATLVGLAGSVGTVTALALDLPGYDPGRVHHARIPAAQVHEVTCRLLAQTRAQRAALGPMHPGRVDVIGAGALILDRVMIRLGFAEVVASEHDILDGIAWSLADG